MTQSTEATRALDQYSKSKPGTNIGAKQWNASPRGEQAALLISGASNAYNTQKYSRWTGLNN